MDLKDLIRRGKEELSGAAMEKMTEWLDDYKKAIAVIETFGFTVGKFKVGMGIPPEVQASVSGSIENIHPDKLKTMVAEHSGEALLVSLLKALILSKQIWEQLDLNLTGVILRITLGVPPKIEVEIF
jgi:hypothetical protein